MVYPTLKLNLIDSNVPNLIELNDTDFQDNPVLRTACSSSLDSLDALIVLMDSCVSQYYDGYLNGLDDGIALTNPEM